jgi:caspase domain-containing protein
MKDDWALVVGINRYPSAGVDPLEGAVYDAKRFHEWVTDPKGGDVLHDPTGNILGDKNHIVLLTSPIEPAGPARPLLSEFFQFFENLLDALGGKNGRRLYLYLSGHGISPSGQEAMRNAALLVANAMPPNRWLSFPGNIWAEGARSAALFREVVLIMDCCRDLKNNATVISHIFGEPVLDAKDCRLIEAYATGWNSKARERPFPPANQIQSVFTHSLLEVLRSGRMTGTLLKESIKEHLADLLKDEKKVQEPEIRPDEDLAKIVFNEQRDPPRTPVTITPVSITGDPAKPPEIEYWPEGSDDSELMALNDWSYDGSLWRGTLEPGQYQLRLPGGRHKRLKIVAGLEKKEVL